MREAIQSADAVLFRPCVLTDAEGVVLDASNNVDRLVNLTRRGLIGRNLFMFFDRDREMVADVAAVATRQPATLATRLRPRDRKPTPVWIRIHAVRGRGANLPRLRWSFE
jgi:PAS domain-containing protein